MPEPALRILKPAVDEAVFRGAGRLADGRNDSMLARQPRQVDLISNAPLMLLRGLSADQEFIGRSWKSAFNFPARLKRKNLFISPDVNGGISFPIVQRTHELRRGCCNARRVADLLKVAGLEITGPIRAVQRDRSRVVGASFRHRQNMRAEAVDLGAHSFAVTLLEGKHAEHRANSNRDACGANGAPQRPAAPFSER